MNNINKQPIDTITAGVILLCVINVLIRLPFAHIPAYFDESVYFSLVKVISNNNLIPFVDYWGYKPPVLFMIPAILFRFIGPSLIWGRIEVYLFSSMSIYYMYRLGTILFAKKIGWYSALLLFTYPLFSAQSMLFQDSVPFLAFFLASLYYYFSRNLRVYALCAALLVMTKEPGIFLPVALFFYDLFLQNYQSKSNKRTAVSRLYLFVPVCVFVVWMLINKNLFGWYLWPGNTELFNNFIFRLLDSINNVYGINEVFSKFFMWPISATVFAGMVFMLGSNVQKRWREHTHIFLLSVLICIYTLFSFGGPIQHRYFLCIYPLLFLLFLKIITFYTRADKFTSRVVVMLCAGFILSNAYYSTAIPNVYNSESTFGFIRTIHFGKKVIDAVIAKYPNAVLASDIYLQTFIKDPLWGYVRKDTNFYDWYDCSHFDKIYIMDEITRQYASPPAQILYMDPPFYNGKCPQIEKSDYVEKICADTTPDTKDCFSIYSIYP